jgi:hypothetical protein
MRGRVVMAPDSSDQKLLSSMSFLVTKVAWVRVPSHSSFLFALSGEH